MPRPGKPAGHRMTDRRVTTVKTCPSKPTVGALYRADCKRCGPSTLFAGGRCVVCGRSGAEAPKIVGRQKPAPVAVASVAGEEWARQRRETPARRTTRGAGIVRA
jgi:hypothetical protein